MPDEHPWFAHYESGVPRAIDVPRVRLSMLLQESVRTWGARTALIYYGRRWTYRELWDATGHLAAALHVQGFRRGDRLALYLPNCPAYPIAYYAALRLGVTIVQVSPLYIGQDLVRVLRDSEPKGIVTLEILYPNLAKVEREVTLPLTIVARLREFYPRTKRPFVNIVLRRRGLPTALPWGTSIRRWSDLLRARQEFPEVRGDPGDDVAVLQYTGGTTGVPKAAMLSHTNLVANALQCSAWFRVPPGSGVMLAAVPFFHIYGMTVALNYPLSVGSTIVLQTRPDPLEILHLIHRYRVTEFPGVPALYQAINRHPQVGRYDLRSVRVCLSGSAPLPREVAREFEALTGGHLIEGYGLTEASPVTHANPIRVGRREGTIGLPISNTEQRVVDLETGARVLGVGEEGELEVRGPQVMVGYYRRPEETAIVMHDGWLRTGDVASIDVDGFACIVDRKKDLILVGGLNVYPREVEEVLAQHPGVREAAVVGVPDRERGEAVKAFVVADPAAPPSAPELIAFVRERIAHYKAPRSVEFLDALPKSGILKVLRRELRRASEAPTRPE